MLKTKISFAEEYQTLVEAIDALAKALDSHGHRWTEKERRLYEKASAMLRKTIHIGE